MLAQVAEIVLKKEKEEQMEISDKVFIFCWHSKCEHGSLF